MLNWSTILDWLPEPVAEFCEVLASALDSEPGTPRDIVSSLLARLPALLRWILPLLSKAMADPAATIRIMSEAEPLLLGVLERLEQVTLRAEDIDTLLARISSLLEATATRTGPDQVGVTILSGMERLLVGWIDEMGARASGSPDDDPP